MVKKISGKNNASSDEAGRKELHAKRLKLKRLHGDVAQDRAALSDKTPDDLPPASSSNAARQARSQLEITFPVNWQKPHLEKLSESDEDMRDQDE